MVCSHIRFQSYFESPRAASIANEIRKLGFSIKSWRREENSVRLSARYPFTPFLIMSETPLLFIATTGTFLRLLPESKLQKPHELKEAQRCQPVPGIPVLFPGNFPRKVEVSG